MLVEPVGEKPKYPCGICNKTIGHNHRAIRCCICNYKIHIKCNKTDIKSYENLEKSKDPCICISCKADNLPFFNLNDEQFKLILNAINIEDDNDLAHSLFPSESLMCFFKGINDLNNPFNGKIDNIPINCQYNSFNYKQNKEDFLLFHLNIASLDKHILELETILSLINYKFDIIGLTETKIKKGFAPTIDIKRKGFKEYSTPAESDKGGAILYVDEEYDSRARNGIDLSMYKLKELESVFIEINNPGQKTQWLVVFIGIHPWR